MRDVSTMPDVRDPLRAARLLAAAKAEVARRQREATIRLLQTAIEADNEAVIAAVVGVTHRVAPVSLPRVVRYRDAWVLRSSDGSRTLATYSSKRDAVDHLRRLQLKVAGDVPGHEFHGNQWTSGSGSAGRVTQHGGQRHVVRGPLNFHDFGNRRFLFDPRQGTMVLGQHYTHEDTAPGSHAEEFDLVKRQDQSLAPFDAYVRGWASQPEDDEAGFIEINLTSADSWPGGKDDIEVAAFDAVLKTVERFVAGGATKDTSIVIEPIRGGQNIPRLNTRRDDATLGTVFPELFRKKSRALGDLPGHEFHGNQYTSGVGGSGAPSSSGSRVEGGSRDARVAATKALARVPDKVRGEVSPLVNVYDSQKVCTDAIDAYLMKHYGFDTQGQAASMTDRERKTCFAVAQEPADVVREYAHSYRHRIDSADWKDARPGRTDVEREHDFVNAFATVMMSEPVTDLLRATSPIAGLVDAALPVFKKWGWVS